LRGGGWEGKEVEGGEPSLSFSDNKRDKGEIMEVAVEAE